MGDKEVICRDCGCKFTLTEKEIAWYNEMGFNLPKRCKKCRKDRKAHGGSKYVSRG